MSDYFYNLINMIQGLLESIKYMGPVSGLLKFGIFKKLIENFSWKGLLLQVNCYPEAILVGFISDIFDSFHPLLLNQICNLNYQLGLIHLIRNLSHYYLKTLLVFHDIGNTPHNHWAPSRSISINNILLIIDHSPSRKVRPLDKLHEFAYISIFIFYQMN